jgi:hypothetical protein
MALRLQPLGIFSAIYAIYINLWDASGDMLVVLFQKLWTNGGPIKMVTWAKQAKNEWNIIWVFCG